MLERAPQFSIGQLARRTGIPVRTIRFWSDAGVLPPSGRTESGYRLYDAEDVARLELVRTLRDLGVGLEAVQQLLSRQATVRDVAQAHAEALDAAIRTLRLQRAVLRTVAKRNSTAQEIALMNTLARLSARERQQIIDDFVERAFAGIDSGAPGAGIAQAMRQMPTELPDDPTPAQVDAWVELAELVQDHSFQRRVRQMAVEGAKATPGQGGPALSAQRVMEHAGQALAEGIAPDSAAAKPILDQIVPLETSVAARRKLIEQLETFSDGRVERFWQLMGIINDRPPFLPAVPQFDWMIRALKAHG